MLTVRQFAQRLGLSATGAYVRRMCQAGRVLGARKVGRDWVIPFDAVIVPPKGRENAR